MAVKNGLNKKRRDIEELGLDAIQEFFNISPDEMKNLDPKILSMLHQKAKIAMSFEREMGISRRSVEMNYLRVFRLISEDKKELKRLIKKSLPDYYED
jgi:hypothetical protein